MSLCREKLYCDEDKGENYGDGVIPSNPTVAGKYYSAMKIHHKQSEIELKQGILTEGPKITGLPSAPIKAHLAPEHWYNKVFNHADSSKSHVLQQIANKGHQTRTGQAEYETFKNMECHKLAVLPDTPISAPEHWYDEVFNCCKSSKNHTLQKIANKDLETSPVKTVYGQIKKIKFPRISLLPNKSINAHMAPEHWYNEALNHAESSKSHVSQQIANKDHETSPVQSEFKQLKEIKYPKITLLPSTPEDMHFVPEPWYNEIVDFHESPKHLIMEKIAKKDLEITQLLKEKVQLTKKEQRMLKRETIIDNTMDGTKAKSGWRDQQCLAQKIYTENRMKSKEAHVQLERLSSKVELPLYNQPSDTEVYHENLRKNALLKKRLVEHLHKEKVEREIRHKNTIERYSKLLKNWQQEVEKNTSSEEWKTTERERRQLFEQVFPEIKKTPTDKKQLGRGGRRAVVEVKEDLQAELNNMRLRAVVPPLLLDDRQRRYHYIDTNRRVEDLEAEYKEQLMINVWSEEEKKIFKEKFNQNPKKFDVIASYLNRKNTRDCIQYYYQTKKLVKYRKLIRKRVRRSTFEETEQGNKDANANYTFNSTQCVATNVQDLVQIHKSCSISELLPTTSTVNTACEIASDKVQDLPEATMHHPKLQRKGKLKYARKKGRQKSYENVENGKEAINSTQSSNSDLFCSTSEVSSSIKLGCELVCDKEHDH